jgi:hypothetical protein
VGSCHASLVAASIADSVADRISARVHLSHIFCRNPKILAAVEKLQVGTLAEFCCAEIKKPILATLVRRHPICLDLCHDFSLFLARYDNESVSAQSLDFSQLLSVPPARQVSRLPPNQVSDLGNRRNYGLEVR